jgi:hypothetical protein
MLLRKAHKLSQSDKIVIKNKKFAIHRVEQHNDMVYVTTIVWVVNIGFTNVIGDTIAFYSDDMVEVE